jgi:hypothetical protein
VAGPEYTEHFKIRALVTTTNPSSWWNRPEILAWNGGCHCSMQGDVQGHAEVKAMKVHLFLRSLVFCPPWTLCHLITVTTSSQQCYYHHGKWQNKFFYVLYYVSFFPQPPTVPTRSKPFSAI